jgi:hypothetical protein
MTSSDRTPFICPDHGRNSLFGGIPCCPAAKLDYNPPSSSNATQYHCYSSDGWTYDTPSFVEAVEQVRYRLGKYGYPKVQDWLVDLVATAGDLSAGPWFYGHVGIETVETVSAPDWDGFTCSVCGEGFDAETWDVRHTDPADELAEVHAECCPCDDTAKLGRNAGLRPFVWDNAELRGSTWVDTEPAEGGASISCSAIRAPHCDETPDYYEVPVATWGDYVGTAVERSNYRSLLRDYPETFVEVRYDYFGHSLLLPVSAVTEELVELLTGLREQYPLYDESDHSELESELADEAWDAWAKFDLLRALRDAGVDTDEIDEADLRERFYTAVSESDEYPYAETADSIVFPGWDAIVAELAEHYGAAS